MVRELGHRLAFVGGDSDSLLVAPVKIPLEDGLFILLSGKACPGLQREVEAFIAGERGSKGGQGMGERADTSPFFLFSL